MTLEEVERRFVSGFEGESRSQRDMLFRSFEEVYQSLLRVKLPCSICLDGSFITKKPKPDDVDIVVCIDSDVAGNLTEDQRIVVDTINLTRDFANIDGTVWSNFPREHELFGSGLDAYSAAEGYGKENGGQHLKGYVVLRLMETNVGLRINR